MIADFLRANPSTTVLSIAKRLDIPLEQAQAQLQSELPSLNDLELQVMYTFSGLDEAGLMHIHVGPTEPAGFNASWDKTVFAVCPAGSQFDMMSQIEQRMRAATITETAAPTSEPVRRRAPEAPKLAATAKPEPKKPAKPFTPQDSDTKLTSHFKPAPAEERPTPPPTQISPPKSGLKAPNAAKDPTPAPRPSVQEVLANSSLYTMEEEDEPDRPDADTDTTPAKPDEPTKRRANPKTASRSKAPKLSNDPLPVTSRKVKKVTTKTYLDGRGKLVTEDVEEYVTDDEAQAPKAMPSRAGTQGSLMRFFKPASK